MHKPVMSAEVIEGLAVKTGGRYIDATLGDGGHAQALLEAIGPTGRLLGVDRDAEALEQARSVLWDWREQYVEARANFESLAEVASTHDFLGADGVLFDLGVRSAQLDHPERGFSFMQDGPLDMRMDQRQDWTAADLVNEWTESELAQVIWRYGEERAARRIAAAVVARREDRRFTRTLDLAEVVELAVGGRRGKTHPATRTFQALRMRVNEELQAIEIGVRSAIDLVRPGGRIAVLTYHSLEDRLVKQICNRHVGQWQSLQAGGQEWVGEQPQLQRFTRKPLVPSVAEVRENPRARSAKLRIVERMKT